MCICVLPACIQVHLCDAMPPKTEDSVRSPGTELWTVVRFHVVAQSSERAVLLTAKKSLQPNS